MNRKWVDNEVYFGPNRRKGGLGKRWGDRRTFDDAAEPPPLSAVLRRLRVHLSNVTTDDDKERTCELAQFALAEAERLQLSACTTHLHEVLKRIARNDLTGADTCVMEAQSALNAR